MMKIKIVVVLLVIAIGFPATAVAQERAGLSKGSLILTKVRSKMSDNLQVVAR